MITHEAADTAREALQPYDGQPRLHAARRGAALAAVDFLEREATTTMQRAERAHALEEVLPDLRNLLVWVELSFAADGNTKNDAIMDRLDDVFNYRTAVATEATG